MGVGNYFFYRGNGSHKAANLTPQEQQKIPQVRQAVFNALSNQPTIAKKIENDRKTVAVTELATAYGSAQSQVGLFSKYIHKNEATKREKLKVYREMAKYPEISFAVDEYVNEAVNFNDKNEVFNFKIKNKNILENDIVRQTLIAEWDILMNDIIKVSDNIDMWFRDYMVDGEVFFEKIFDDNNPELGVNRVKKLMTFQAVPIYGDIESQEILFFSYMPLGAGNVIPLHKEQIAYANSGLLEWSMDEQEITVNSILETGKTMYRRLKLMEDAMLIYRITRASEKRIFKIDVGNLPKGRADQFMQETVRRHRQKKFFDPQSGDVSDGLDPIALTEDYYFPTFNGGRGTSVDTLPGATNLSDVDDINYFLKKLYVSLKIPLSRWGEEKKVQFGSEGELNTDELKFLQEVRKYARRFSAVFKDIFFTHIKLKGIDKEYGITESDIDVEMFSNNLYEKFIKAKNEELTFAVFDKYKELIDTESKPLSQEWVIKKFLNVSEDDWIENTRLVLLEQEAKKQREAEAEGGGSDGGAGGGLGDLGGGGSSSPDAGGLPDLADMAGASEETSPDASAAASEAPAETPA